MSPKPPHSLFLTGNIAISTANHIDVLWMGVPISRRSGNLHDEMVWSDIKGRFLILPHHYKQLRHLEHLELLQHLHNDDFWARPREYVGKGGEIGN